MENMRVTELESSPANKTHTAQSGEEYDSEEELTRLSNVADPSNLSPEERLNNARCLLEMAYAGKPIDVSSIHPQTAGPETLTSIRQLQGAQQNRL